MAVGDLSIVLVYVLVVLLEIIEVFYQAAESAILPEIISKDLLNEAMSLSKLDDGIVYVATPAIGTVMYKLFGVQGGALDDHGIFLPIFPISFWHSDTALYSECSRIFCRRMSILRWRVREFSFIAVRFDTSLKKVLQVSMADRGNRLSHKRRSGFSLPISAAGLTEALIGGIL